MTAAARRPQRTAAARFLAVFAVVLVAVAWWRGAGRFVLPLAFAVLAAVLIARAVRAHRDPQRGDQG